MGEKILGLKEEIKKINDRLQALEKQQQRSLVGNAGLREKSGERADYATEAGGQEITPSEQQLRQAASSSYRPSPFFQLQQQPPPPPPSQPPPD